MRADIYWIADVPNGRLAILGRPRSGDWLSDEITDWKAAGLTDIVSLLEDHEIRELDLAGEAELVERDGLSFEQFSIPDRGVPASSEAAQILWKRLETKVRNGHSVGIHCRASIGRAGLVAVGVLLRLGIPERAAWQRVLDAANARPRRAIDALAAIPGLLPPHFPASRSNSDRVSSSTSPGSTLFCSNFHLKEFASLARL
jgi:protein-tyrosine phosphatase